MPGATPDPTSDAKGEARDRARSIDASLGWTDWSKPAEGAVLSRFAAPSGELAVISLGEPSNPRVVLIPGATGSKEDFVLMLPVLAKAGYFVQSLDLPGQFQSAGAGPQNRQPLTYDLVADDITAFLEQGSPAHVLGYSFAGIVAQMVALDRPDLVRSLSLLTTPPTSGNVFTRVKRIGRLAPLASPRIGGSLMIWGVRLGLNRPPADRLEFVRERFRLTDSQSVHQMVGLMMNSPDLADALRESDVPVMVASSTHDLWPVDLYRQFADRAGAQLHIYDTGHSPCETTPHELSHDLIQFYKQAEAEGR